MNDETLASNATQLIFKLGAINGCQGEAVNEGLKMDAEKPSVVALHSDTADMVRNLSIIRFFLKEI